MPKPSNEEDDRAQVIPVVRVIMGVVSEKDRQGYVGDFLHKVTSLNSMSIMPEKSLGPHRSTSPRGAMASPAVREDLRCSH